MAHHIIHRAAILSTAAAGFEPWNMDNLLLMLHAPYEGGNAPAAISSEAQNPSIAPGDPVETATDWSGNGNHPTQATLSLRPTWESGILGTGSHAYDFDGVGDRWTFSLTSDEELYIVIGLNRGTNNPCFPFHWGTPLNFSTLACVAQASGQAIVQMRGDSGSAYQSNGTWPLSASYERFNWYSNIDFAKHIADIDDVNAITGIAGVPVGIASKAQTFEIGARGGSFSINGSIGSFFIFSTKPTDDDIASLNAWIDGQWT